MAVSTQQYRDAYNLLFSIAFTNNGAGDANAVFALYNVGEFLTDDPFRFLGLGTTTAQDAAEALQYIADNGLTPEGNDG